jgi:hypothetical protein
MPIVRRQGWEGRLETHFGRYRSASFVYGLVDCGCFLAGAVKALDPSFAWQPPWRNEDEAVRYIVRAGGLIAATTGILGSPGDNWRTMRRGDAGLVNTEGEPGLVVCSGQTLCGPGPGKAGLQHHPLRLAEKIWRIG